MWPCPHCNELIESSHDVCWNCGTSQDGKRDRTFQRADDLTPSDTANLSQLDPLSFGHSSSPPPLPRIRFGLRTLLGVVAVCAVLIAALAWYAKPKTSDDYFRRGMTRLDMGKFADAVADLTCAVNLLEKEDHQGHLPLVYAARAAAYNNQCKYANSVRDISKAIDSLAAPPGFPGLLSVGANGQAVFVPQQTITGWRLLRANGLIGLGRREQAITDLNAVLQYDPRNKAALHLLAIADGRKKIDN
jgi:tetratricopeptide (TPR) repeat protein